MGHKLIYRAGVIPYYIDEDNIHMLFMVPSVPAFGGSSFQASKGRVEENESDEVAAFREGTEELGLFEGNVVSRHHLGNFLGRTQMYIAEIKDANMFGDPCDETGDVKWMTPSEFDSEGRTLHRPMIKAAVRLIKKVNNLK